MHGTMKYRRSAESQGRRTPSILLFPAIILCWWPVQAFRGDVPLVRRKTSHQLSSVGIDSFSSSTMVPSADEMGSSIISHLAECAIQLRLRSHSGVSCQVTADPARMLASGGMLGPVTVKGRGWASPLGLTCRAIEATVESCQLDFARVLRDRKLRLTEPAKGKALVALTSQDFGNFITHPLLKQQISQIHGFQLKKENVSIDGIRNRVIFYGETQYASYECVLSRNGSAGGASVQVRSMSEATENRSKELSAKLSQFFNQLIFELDGTFLSFHDMRVNSPRNKSGQATLMLALSIEVHKLPSRGLEF